MFTVFQLPLVSSSVSYHHFGVVYTRRHFIPLHSLSLPLFLHIAANAATSWLVPSFAAGRGVGNGDTFTGNFLTAKLFVSNMSKDLETIFYSLRMCFGQKHRWKADQVKRVCAKTAELWTLNLWRSVWRPPTLWSSQRTDWETCGDWNWDCICLQNIALSILK